MNKADMNRANELQDMIGEIIRMLNAGDSPTVEMASEHNVVAQVRVVIDLYTQMDHKIQQVIDSLQLA